MRTLPARAVLSSELLWWELLIDASQCWGNRLKKSFSESLERTVYSVENDAMPFRHVQALANANRVDDDNVVEKISRVSDATHAASAEKIRSLFSEVHEGLGNIFGFGSAKKSMKPGVLKANVRFWSALADLYAEGGMLVDAHDVLKGLECSSGEPFRTLITGHALPGQCSKYTQQEGERSNDRMNSGFLPWSHEGHVKEGHCACKVVTDEGLKYLMTRTNLSRSSGCLKVINGFGRSLSGTTFRRAMSTSTEKQCDEDVGEQQSPSQQQSASQQQSSLEVPESKPQGGSSWPNPDNAASYVLMSNIYADGDRWDEVKRINEMRLKARAWKKPGKAYVEIKAKVHEFIVGDRTHQDSVNIYEKLRKIKRHMGHIGYVPNVDLILENRSSYDPYKPR